MCAILTEKKVFTLGFLILICCLIKLFLDFFFSFSFFFVHFHFQWQIVNPGNNQFVSLSPSYVVAIYK